MTIACAAALVGFVRQPDQLVSIAGSFFSGLLRDLSLDVSFRFGMSFSWPSSTELAKLTQLTSVDLSGCDKITDAGVTELAKLTRLTSV